MVNYATAPINHNIQKDMLNVRNKIDKLNQKIATEKKYQKYSEVPIDKLQLIRELTNNVKTLNRVKENNEILAQKLDIYQNSLLELHTLLDKGFQLIQSIGFSGNNRSLNILAVEQTANQYMSEIQGVLNRSFNGQYLFSGSKVSTTPVANVVLNPSVITDTSTGDTSYVITSNYYSGDDIIPQAKVSKDTTMTYGLMADNQVFQNFFAVFQFAKFFANSHDEQHIQKSLDLLEGVQTDLGAMIGTLGENSKILNQVIQNQADQITEYSSLLESLTTVDASVAYSELSEKTNQLQAIYMVSSKMQGMFLGNYI